MVFYKMQPHNVYNDMVYYLNVFSYEHSSLKQKIKFFHKYYIFVAFPFLIHSLQAQNFESKIQKQYVSVIKSRYVSYFKNGFNIN